MTPEKRVELIHELRLLYTKWGEISPESSCVLASLAGALTQGEEKTLARLAAVAVQHLTVLPLNPKDYPRCSDVDRDLNMSITEWKKEAHDHS